MSECEDSCPCENCICKARCRYKSYINLIECFYIKDFFYSYKSLPGQHSLRRNEPLRIIKECLKPNKWEVLEKHFNFPDRPGEMHLFVYTPENLIFNRSR
jgi:hypothetical protein